ncbi:hypothetical protein GCM10020256_01900 [Streptomyces thermocoprophilus]
MAVTRAAWRSRADDGSSDARGLAPLRGAVARWRERDAVLKDGVLALALTAMAFVPTLSAVGAQIGELPERPADLPGVALVVAQALPLAVRRRWPAGCLAVVGCAFAVHQASGYATTFASLGLYAALYSVGGPSGPFPPRSCGRGGRGVRGAGRGAGAARVPDAAA